MIRPLRIRHRWMIVTIALVVGVLLVLGLLARRSIPTVEDLPAVGAVHDAEAPSRDLVAESHSADRGGPSP